MLNKNTNLGPKLPRLCIFGLEFEKTIGMFEISTLEFPKNEFLINIVNFRIGSVFSKGLACTFFEGPGLVVGPLCKVCQYS